ncbi:MAG: hypothetical protein JWP74_1421 [Marmoricola sp.]|nr:hypothetical protein [Marmoricola sp.]
MDHERQVAQPLEAPDLTIGDVAQRTGLNPAVLRMWETRHGFPVPRRLASGHRRYSETDVELVSQVLRRKDAGIRLEVAIAETAAVKPPESPSIFAELRRLHPALAVHRLRKKTLVALSRAIEDECCAVADRPVIFGAFQRGDFYEPSAQRWSELARTARSAIVFADDWEGSAPDAEGPVRAGLDEHAPMRREWAVVCDALDFSACLSAWELPGQLDVPDSQRLFESVWTLSPVAVRDAARIAGSIAADSGVPGARQLLSSLTDPPAPGSINPAGATALFNRVIAYVDRLTWSG